MIKVRKNLTLVTVKMAWIWTSFDCRWEKRESDNEGLSRWVFSVFRENKASSIKQMGKLIWQSVTENLKIRNSGPSVSDHVRLDRIAHRLVMGNKGRYKYPGCDGIVKEQQLHLCITLKRNCFLEFSKMWVGLITWSHSYKRIVTYTQSIISVGNMKRKGES